MSYNASLTFEWPDTSAAGNDGFSAPVLLPNGEYRVEISSITMRDTKNGAGTYLDVKFTVVAGQQSNKSVYIKYFVKHTTAQTKLKVDVKRLQDLQQALLGRTTTDASDMIGKRCIVELGTQYGKDKGDGTKWADANTIIRARAIPVDTGNHTGNHTGHTAQPSYQHQSEPGFDDQIPF